MAAVTFDIGDDILGIYSVEDDKYIPYRGDKMKDAVRRLLEASEIVSYNGKGYDIEKINQLFENAFVKFSGNHSDMREICWSARIWGKSLRDTYAMQYSESPEFPDTYEGSNERDVYETYMLWLAWKNGELVVVDGNQT
jgi:uncharacterized protein YprB with RNaseH-like and TPR domain